MYYGHKGKDGWLLQFILESGVAYHPWQDLRLAVDSKGKVHMHHADGSYATNDVRATPLPGVTLSVQLPAAFAGKVLSTPPGLSCPPNCAATLPANTLVQLAVTLEAPAFVAGCRPREPGDTLHWLCEKALRAADASVALKTQLAPVGWATAIAGPGDETVLGVAATAANVVALGTAAPGATVAGVPLGVQMSGEAYAVQLDAQGKRHWGLGLGARPQAGALAVAGRAECGVMVALAAGEAFAAKDKAATAVQPGLALLGLAATGELAWARNLLKTGQAQLVGLQRAGPASWLAATFANAADVGSGALSSAGGTDALLVRLDSAGNSSVALAVGSAGEDFAVQVAGREDGVVLLALRGTGVVSVAGKPVGDDLPPSAAWIGRFDAQGKLLASHVIGDMQLHGLAGLVALPDGFAARTNAGLNFVHRYDGAGKLLWSHQGMAKVSYLDMQRIADGRLVLAASSAAGMTGETAGQWLSLDANTGAPSYFAVGAPLGERVTVLAGKLVMAGSASGDVAFGPLVLPGVGGSDAWVAGGVSP